MLEENFDRVRLELGNLTTRVVRSAGSERMTDWEFRVFSQWGEDGILQFLLDRVPIAHDTFVEFGVGDYRESNTRFLVLHSGWTGLVIDGGRDHIDFIDKSELSWRYQLDAVSAFITAENIDELLRANGFEGDIGLLSIDVDGNDYWILDAITAVSPRILIAEYNSTFGPDLAVTVPYDPTFHYGRAHHSLLYFGASLAALAFKAGERGYRLVGSDSSGTNAFFVRDDVTDRVPEVSVAAAYRPSRFRTSRGLAGEATRITNHQDRLREIRDLDLIDVTSGDRSSIAALYGV